MDLRKRRVRIDDVDKNCQIPGLFPRIGVKNAALAVSRGSRNTAEGTMVDAATSDCAHRNSNVKYVLRSPVLSDSCSLAQVAVRIMRCRYESWVTAVMAATRPVNAVMSEVKLSVRTEVSSMENQLFGRTGARRCCAELTIRGSS